MNYFHIVGSSTEAFESEASRDAKKKVWQLERNYWKSLKSMN